jgi:hypothetical protein
MVVARLASALVDFSVGGVPLSIGAQRPHAPLYQQCRLYPHAFVRRTSSRLSVTAHDAWNAYRADKTHDTEDAGSSAFIALNTIALRYSRNRTPSPWPKCSQKLSMLAMEWGGA